jgi:hypothetical protein
MRHPSFAPVLNALTCLALTFTACTAAPPANPGQPITTNATGAWSNPATWGGRLPDANSAVTIPAGTTITLDTSINVKSLEIAGVLEVAAKELTVNANWVMVSSGGSFRAGSANQPFAGKLKVNLTGIASDANVMGMGTKFLGTMGGDLQLYGTPKRAWTKLAATANRAQSQLALLEAPDGWQVGDEIVVAPTDYDPLEVETRTITAIAGNTITLNAPLNNMHWGTLQTINGIQIDQRAEVANLSRNITVSGATDSLGDFGGHMMFMTGSVVRLDNVEVTRMGQLGRVGRYPVHFHVLGDGGSRSTMTNSVIHRTFQRGLVIHQTNNLTIKNNVIFDTVGMQYFLEDGVETGNRFERNLGVLARKVPDGRSLSNERVDRGDNAPGPERPAIFWITNTHNTFIDNAAVGAIGGWGYAFRPTDVIPKNRTVPLPADTSATDRLPALEFSGNSARTIASSDDHFNLGYGPEEAGSCVRFGGASGGPVSIVDAHLSKCFNAAFWSSSDLPIIGGTIADARTAMVQDQGVASSPVIQGAGIVAFSNNDPSRAAAGTLDRGPFGQSLFDALEAGVTKLVNAQVVGRFDNPAQNPAFTAPTASTTDGDFTLNHPTVTMLGMNSGESKQIPLSVTRRGYSGAITVTLPELERAEDTAGFSADPLTIPAGSTTATLTVRALNTRTAQQITEGSSAKTFALNLLTSGGGRTKIDTIALVEMGSTYLVSKPGVNIAAGYNTYSPRGLSRMEMNRGVNFAFDGKDDYAEASGPQAWAEIVWDHRQAIGQIRLWQPLADAANPLWGDFVVLTSDFALIPDDMGLDTALQLPFVKVFNVSGLAGVKGAPTVINLPAGTTARSVRVWLRGSASLRLQEMEVVGR